MTDETHCPLCAGVQIAGYCKDRRRSYVYCGTCGLVFVPPREYVTREAERAEYDLHQNDIDDPGYRSFLSRLKDPLLERLPAGASGLDFGCGPGPALAHMLQESGFRMALYDSFFFPDEAVLEVSYEFICATEVVEHLHHPGEELERLWSLLPKGGWLAIMTRLVRNRAAFTNWHYKNDPTHVCFFSRDTWRWWAQRYGASLEVVGQDVVLMQRKC